MAAPINTTYGSLVIEQSLPKDIQDLSRKYDKKMVTKVLKEVAKNYPDMYSNVADVLLRVGDQFATRHGKSFKLENEFTPSPGRDKVVEDVDKKVQAVLKSKLPQNVKLDRIGEIFDQGGKLLEKMVAETGKERDSLMYNQLVSGAKGNPLQLRMVNEAAVGVVDHRNRPIPVTIKHSYAEGVTPNEMFALTYGARKGLIATKMATADTGYFEKILTLLNIDTVITTADCGTTNGVIRPVTDTHNVDKYLASSAGIYSRNDLITPDMLGQLQKKKITHIRVRSPMTCEADGGGLCSKCFGLDENGKLPGVGTNVGVNAAQGMAEPLTQMSMNTKHTGGAVGSAGIGKGGFSAVSQLLMVPKNFPGGAVVAPEDGRVSEVRPAPQGGTYITVNEQRLYAPPGAAILVRKGDQVEAGQQLSEGLINPKDIVAATGIGHARKVLVDSLRDVFQGAGKDTPVRHLEITARNMLNLVESDNSKSGHLVGSAFKLSSLKETPYWDKKEMSVAQANGKYLARNYLHHTIGTRIGSRVISDLQQAGITKVMITDTPPMFNSTVTSIDRVPLQQEDFLARMGSSRVGDSFMRAAHEGHSSKVHNTTNPIPAYALGAEFGKNTTYY